MQRWLLKAPVYLFKAHLGALLGTRFVMIEHRGRKSGRQYQTVLEVAGHNPARGELIVAAGYGPRSDWFRNLREGNLEAVWVGSRRHENCTARFLESAEAARFMQTYETEHPKAAASIYRLMGVSHDGTFESIVAMMDEIPMVALGVVSP